MSIVGTTETRMCKKREELRDWKVSKAPADLRTHGRVRRRASGNKVDISVS